jgi:hypothetical protein
MQKTDSPPPSHRSPKRKNTELSVLSSKSHYATYQYKSPDNSISLLMLESYLSDIVKTISEHKSITEHSYMQVGPMRNILSDCMSLSNITFEFYSQVDAALNLLCKIYEYSCTSMIKDLVRLLARICGMIGNKEHFTQGVSVPMRESFGTNLDQCLVELKIRMNRVTPRVINVRKIQIFRNILSPAKEIEVVCYGFLKFYCEIDPTIPRPGYEDPMLAMSRFSRNPGHVVQMIRKTKSYLDEEMISLRIAREVNRLIQKTPPEVLTCVDKTLTGFIIWDLVRYSLEYYRTYGLFHYKLDIFESNLIDDFEDEDMAKTNKFPFVEMESVSKGCKSVKKFKNSKEFKRRLSFSSPVRVRKSPVNSRLDDYNSMVQEKFQEFLVNKLRTSSNSPKKNELLDEFSSYLTRIDQVTIDSLWDRNNLSKTALNLKFL